MNVKGKITVFKNEKEITLTDGSKTIIPTYTGSLSRKNEDGTYSNSSIEVVFYDELKDNAKERMRTDTAYQIDVKNGFLSFRTYTNKDGKNINIPQILINEIKILEQVEVDPAKKKLLEGVEITASDLF